jgi:hypothetical protein
MELNKYVPSPAAPDAAVKPAALPPAPPPAAPAAAAPAPNDEQSDSILLVCPQCERFCPEHQFVDNLCDLCDKNLNCLKVGDVIYCYLGVYAYGDERGKQEGTIVKLNQKNIRLDGKIEHFPEPFMELSNGFYVNENLIMTKTKNLLPNGLHEDVRVTRPALDFKLIDGVLSRKFIKKHKLYEWKEKRAAMFKDGQRYAEELFKKVWHSNPDDLTDSDEDEK